MCTLLRYLALCFILLASRPAHAQQTFLDSLDGLDVLALVGQQPHTGEAVAMGDIDGDGFDDLAVGVPSLGGPPGGFQFPGAVYLYFGSSAATPPALDLDTTNCLRLIVSEHGAAFGSDVALGDVDGDGKLDIIASAPQSYVNGAYSGQVVVTYWTPAMGKTGEVVVSDLLGTQASAVDGAYENHYLYQVSAGDLDDDGYDEVIIGTVVADVGGAMDAGEVYVLFGGPEHLPAEQTVDTKGRSNFLIHGTETFERFGTDLATADFDGDEVQDLAIGIRSSDVNGFDSGQVAVLFGRTDFPRTGRFTTKRFPPPEGSLINGARAEDNLGLTVLGADLNADGFADLVMGAPIGPASANLAGRICVYYGRPSFPGVVHLEDLLPANGGDGSDGLILEGVNDAAIPTALAVGDFDGDQVADLLYSSARSASFAGVSTLLPGPIPPLGPVFELSTLTPADAFFFYGPAGSRAGVSVAMGDGNGDGRADIAIGAPADVPVFGWAYLVYGPSPPATSVGASPPAGTWFTASPNPFGAETVLSFDLPPGGDARLTIYDVAGRFVRALEIERRGPETGNARWDGRLEDGRVAPTGFYLVRLETAEGRKTRKLLLLR